MAERDQIGVGDEPKTLESLASSELVDENLEDGGRRRSVLHSGSANYIPGR